jgi:hypothetical protein
MTPAITAKLPLDFDSPNWACAASDHWTKFVPTAVRNAWGTLSRDARIVAYLSAEECARRLALFIRD